MKRLTIALLTTLAFSNTFGNNEETKETQVQAKSNVKKDLAKGFTALAGAGLFGYLSYASYLKKSKLKNEYNMIDKLSKLAYKKIGNKIEYIIPTDTAKTYFKNNLGTVGNALIAAPCAAYAAYKLGSVIAAKTPASVKQKASSAYSKVTDKVKANWKRPFSWLGSKLRSKPTANKRISEISDFDAQIKANLETK